MTEKGTRLATGFAAAQLWGEGAGMPILALGATLWTAAFVRWSARRRHS